MLTDHRTPKAPKGRSSPHLRDLDVQKICQILEEWPLPTLTWAALCREVEQKLGTRWSRQALERHEAIKARFQEIKRGRRPSNSDEITDSLVARLRMKIRTLESIICQYDERFVRHIFNATRLGLTGSDLNSPVPTVPKGQTERTSNAGK